jgi:hypothetical protein
MFPKLLLKPTLGRGDDLPRLELQGGWLERETGWLANSSRGDPPSASRSIRSEWSKGRAQQIEERKSTAQAIFWQMSGIRKCQLCQNCHILNRKDLINC